jgi:ATP-dependent Clp protease ATP-binding subunit ClpC
MHKLLTYSQYDHPILLNRVFNRTASLALLLILVISALVLIALRLTFDYVALWPIARIIIIFGIFDFVYWLFLSGLMRPPKISDLQQAEVISSGKIAMLLDYDCVKGLSDSVSGDLVKVRSLIAALKGSQTFQFYLKRFNITFRDFFERVDVIIPQDESADLSNLLAQSKDIMAARGDAGIGLDHLLVALSGLSKHFETLLFEYDLKNEDVFEVGRWAKDHFYRKWLMPRFWDPENLLKIKGVGKDWSAGYTPELDRVGHDITNMVMYNPPERIYGHWRYIEQIERFLVDGSHNVIMVGEPGVGRHTTIQHFAELINSGNVLRPLQYIRLVQIDPTAILSSAVKTGNPIDRLRLIFNQALWAGNVILVVDNIDALFDQSAAMARIDATEALLPFLKSRLKIIGTTTEHGFQSTIAKNSELLRWFGKVDVKEPGFGETLRILQDHAERIERRSGLVFIHQALKQTVELATRLIQRLPNPEKSLEILEATAIYAATKSGQRIVLPEHVQAVVTERTRIPVEHIKGQEKEVLLNLESLLHQRIIGQDDAVVQISNAMRRTRSGISSSKRPIGSFLFLGPTGVGKTETTKALASVYFGNEKRIIRLDMSEYQEIRSINRLIGDKETNQEGQLTEAIVTNPFTIVLLDEIEKAHPKVLDLFLQVLDEGRLTDASGRTSDFTNAMIIATSNAGSELIRQQVKENKEKTGKKDEILDYLQKQQIFRPEFLNRFDAIIVFQPLTYEQLLEVSRLVVIDLNKRLEEKEISVAINDVLLKYIVDNAYSPEFGARPLRRFVSDKIENYIATGIINGSIKRGRVLEFGPDMAKTL